MSDFKAKMHKIRFRLGLRPRPRWGSLQRSPDPLAGFKGPTSRRKGGKRREGKGRGGKGMGSEWKDVGFDFFCVYVRGSTASYPIL